MLYPAPPAAVNDRPRPPRPPRAVQRRLKSFGRNVAFLKTTLIEIDAPLAGHPDGAAIARGIRDWSASVSRTCFVCNGRTDVTDAAAILVAVHPRRRNEIAATGCCRSCWTSLPIDEIEAAAVEALRFAIPQGKFLDARPACSE